ncbi:hypothetical protein BH11BAC3_BH11BAC3_07970 [soil metagenome]
MLLSKNSVISKFVQQEIKWVQQDELKTGLRKLFVIQLDDVSIPLNLSSFQVLANSGNFVIDFFNLITGINSKASYYDIAHESDTDSESGYNIKLYVNAPPKYLEKIEKVEYRFDEEFHYSESVWVVDSVERSKKSIATGFAISFWTNEPVLVFVVIYLKSIRQITFEHRVSLYF